MKLIKAAIGRTYNARSWEGQEGKTFSTRFFLDDFEVIANIGSGLVHPVRVMKIGVPVKKHSADISASHAKTIEIPGPDLFPAENYLEIVAYKNFEVPNDLFENFKARKKEAVGHVSKMAKEAEKQFYSALDFAAGFIGLILDKNLVSSLIVEQSYIYDPDSTKYTVSSASTFTTIASISLATAKAIMTESQNPGSKKLIKKWDLAAKPFAWLLRAWGTNDKILKFISFFTAIEMMTPGLNPEKNNKWIAGRDQIISIIKNSRDDNRKSLGELMTKMQAPNSILDRFAEWAAAEAQPGWEEDIKAFKRFSRMRNALLHRGIEEFDLKVAIDDKDVRSLEDIAQRYVFNSVFRS